MSGKLFLVDGSGFIFRAFHALPPLTTPAGVPAGAVYGFCSMLLKTIDQAKENKLLVIFDAARQTFRQSIYKDYKAHRPPAPDDLIPQFDLIRKACDALGVPFTEMSGYEADDLIASYAEKASKTGQEVIIISSDKDLMQLVGPGISLYDPLKNKRIDVQQVIEKFGVPPHQVIDVQALAGDASDNVPGVPGIGIKTAAELIKSYGTLDALLSNLNTIKQPKRREALTNHAENARISKQLVTLVKTVDLPLALETLEIVSAATEPMNDFFKEMGFNSLLNRLIKTTPHPIKMQGSYTCVQTIDQLEAWKQRIKIAGFVAFDCETTSLTLHQAKLVGVSFGICEDGTTSACYIPFCHDTSEPQIPLTQGLTHLKQILEDVTILKIGHNLKYDMGIMARLGITIAPYDDTMLMSYCLDAGLHGHGLDELSKRHLDHETIKFTDVVGTGKNQKTFDKVPLQEATAYAAEDADVTLRLHKVLVPRLMQAHKNTLYQKIERPLSPVIMTMEKNGIRIDPIHLKACEKEFDERLAILEHTIYELAGETFNIASPKQLGEILFDKFSLPGGKKGKTGAYSTDADVLENLALQGHALPEKVLQWRSLAKLKSTYIDGLIDSLNPETGRVHTSYSMVGAATGRLSSSDPNLQNIPIRHQDGRKIRQAFVATPDHQLVSLDYSQIELRLLAHYAGIDSLKQAFQQGADIHKLTAATIFNVPYESIDSALRRKAKAINFGIIYGISGFGLGRQLGIPTGEANQIIQAYLQTYPGIKAYMDQCIQMAREKGYVETLFGRRCHTPGIHDKNPMMRQFSERQAINAPLQGSNADIIKLAMIKIHDVLTAFQTKLLLQVHDELLFDVPDKEIETIVPQLKKIMESVAALSVPLVVEVGNGKNWDEAH